MAEKEKGFWDYATPILTEIGSAAATGYYNKYNMDQQNKFNAEQAEINRQFNEAEAEKARQFNAAEAEKARQYEASMSNTAYTRQMQDMANAGLNPHLAGGQGGASTPAGAAASGSAATGTAATSAGMLPLDINGAINAASNAAMLKSTIDKTKAETGLINKQSGKTEAETKMTEVMTEIEQARAPLQNALIEAQTKEQKTAAKKNMAEYDARVKELEKMDAEILALEADGKLKEAQKLQVERLTKGIQTREWINSILGGIGRLALLGAML